MNRLPRYLGWLVMGSFVTGTILVTIGYDEDVSVRLTVQWGLILVGFAAGCIAGFILSFLKD